MNEFQTINVNLLNLSEEEREQLMGLIKKANQTHQKRWRGEKNDVYYSITGDGKIVDARESEYTCDNDRYQIGNYFKTKEEAEFELNKRLVYQELKDYALEHNEMGIDWKNNEQEKWVVSYDNQFKCLRYRNRYTLSDIGQIYFSSCKIAREAVKAIGEDRIKKYLFNINKENRK